MTLPHALTPILEPQSVAVIGASSDPEKRGHQVLAALRASGFPGTIYPVNPKGGEILDFTVFKSLTELPEAPDLAYVALPAALVPDVVRECGQYGTKGAIVPAVGFRESGKEGAELEACLLAAAQETGVRVIGPNTSGLLNTHAHLHMVGGEPLPPGGLAILAQSGNIALDLMTAASARPIGVSIYVGPGNETDIGFHEYLEFLGSHEPTRAIVMYLEGVADGEALFEMASRVTRYKPVVVLKGGISRAGERTARSHTGAVTGSHKVFSALAREAQMIEVVRADELLAVAETLATQPLVRPRSDDTDGGVVVLSDGGGHATLSADHLSKAGVPLAQLSSTTHEALRQRLGPAANVNNPIDAAGAADQAPTVLGDVLQILASDRGCHAILITGLFGGYSIRFAEELATEECEAADQIVEAVRKEAVPIVVHSLYAARLPPALVRLLEREIPVYGSLETAIRCLTSLCVRGAAAESLVGISEGQPGANRKARYGSEDVNWRKRSSQGSWLSELETRELLTPFGVPMVPSTFCHERKDAAAAVGKGPHVLKLVSRHLPHKTEAGAVRLGIEGSDQAEVELKLAVDSASTYLAERGLPLDFDGFLVSPMQPKPLVELLIGARQDPQFGPILTLGMGGVEVELFNDVAIRGLPIEEDQVVRMCHELTFSPLLFGYRGRASVDINSIAKIGVAVGACLLTHPNILELELNPVFAYVDQVVAVDATAYVGSIG
mgnify:FL=1